MVEHSPKILASEERAMMTTTTYRCLFNCDYIVLNFKGERFRIIIINSVIKTFDNSFQR